MTDPLQMPMMEMDHWLEELDCMGAAACPASLWLHWSVCADPQDPEAHFLLDYLLSLSGVFSGATRERALLAKCSEYTLCARCDANGARAA